MRDTPVSQGEYDALIDLAVNRGATGLNEETSPRLNLAIRQADYEAIGNEIRYTRGGGRQLGGLVNRSNRRQNIFRNGDYRDPR